MEKVPELKTIKTNDQSASLIPSKYEHEPTIQTVNFVNYYFIFVFVLLDIINSPLKKNSINLASNNRNNLMYTKVIFHASTVNLSSCQ